MDARLDRMMSRRLASERARLITSPRASANRMLEDMWDSSANSWLLLGNIGSIFCLLWFGGSPLNY